MSRADCVVRPVLCSHLVAIHAMLTASEKFRRALRCIGPGLVGTGQARLARSTNCHCPSGWESHLYLLSLLPCGPSSTDFTLHGGAQEGRRQRMVICHWQTRIYHA